jgi:pyruvate, water dikinase
MGAPYHAFDLVVGFVHANVTVSVGVQRMVRSDLAASGVMLTLDTARLTS